MTTFSTFDALFDKAVKQVNKEQQDNMELFIQAASAEHAALSETEKFESMVKTFISMLKDRDIAVVPAIKSVMHTMLQYGMRMQAIKDSEQRIQGDIDWLEHLALISDVQSGGEEKAKTGSEERAKTAEEKANGPSNAHKFLNDF